jgi:hypothetical protein
VEEKLVEFVEDFHREVLARADATDTEKEEAFTDTMCDHLVDFGDIDDYRYKRQSKSAAGGSRILQHLG